jgi:hypothetical protein
MEESNIPCTSNYEPSPMPADDRMRETRIQQLSSGYVVSVGCQSFAFSTKEEMVGKLLEYINSPAITEKNWFSGKLFN